LTKFGIESEEDVYMFIRCKLATVNPDSRRFVGQLNGREDGMWENKIEPRRLMRAASGTNTFVRATVEKQSYTLVAKPPISLRDLGLLRVVWENENQPCRLMSAASGTNTFVRATVEKQSYALVAKPPISLRVLEEEGVWENKIEPCRLMTAASRTNTLVRATVEKQSYALVAKPPISLLWHLLSLFCIYMRS
jgi:hypothetical protein